MPFPVEVFRETWKRIILRRLQFRDKHRRLELLYKIEDPWRMNSEKEQFRFLETNRFLRAQVAKVDALLEVGCGEGHQTEAFQSVAKRVFGVDVSESAIKRAIRRCPQSTFLACDIARSERPTGWPSFDVVTACEVLYYMSNIRRAISAMESCGNAMLVTYVDDHRGKLDPIILSKPNVVSTGIAFGDTRWTAAFWRTGSPSS
jgi:2-polyprenyl-3-methyl-5-hydroxy-6-metoxy-1,4-benzoquinol methylase